VSHNGETLDDDPLTWLEKEFATEGTRADFHRQLDACDAVLIELGQRVGGAVVPVTEAFLQADRHAAEGLIGADLAVAGECLELEERCYVLLARQQPVARDLRRLVAIVRSVSDVQRSASLLDHVAESLTWVHPPSMPDQLRQTIAQLGDVAGEIFLRAVAAWSEHDGLAANELQGRDDQVDLLQQVLLTELYSGSQSVEEAVSLALIARYYERVADHGVEMARQVTYVVTGERVPPENN
jgi:phosphate transport system protein